MQVNYAGEKCHCGNFGCLETEVSDAVIVKKVQQAIERGETSPFTDRTITIENIYQAAANGDPLCEKIVIEAADYLGKAISILINMFNPEKIIVAGKITKAKSTLFNTLQQCIVHQSLPEFQNGLKIDASDLQPDSTIASFALIKQAIYEGSLLQKIDIT